MEDRELLREYIERHSEQAFTELVARHVNLVYSTALRVVGDGQMAQDVAQATFISLARKAGSLRDHDALGGWLYRAAHNAAANFVRAEQRRRQREAEAVSRAELESDPRGAWEAIRPFLETAMRQLKPAEQDALVARYFQGKSVRETGQALAITEDAVQKRISRALDKLRAHFARKGVVVSAALLTTALSSHAVQGVPPGLAAALASSSLAGAGSAAATSPASILKFLVMTKAQAVTLGLLFLAGVATPLTVGPALRGPGASARSGASRATGATGVSSTASGNGAASLATAAADSPALARLRDWLTRAQHSALVASHDEDMRRVTRGLAPSDFPRAWALYCGLKPISLRGKFGPILMAAWGAKDGPAAVAAALAVTDSSRRNSFLDSAACAWARNHPADAAAWIKYYYPETEQALKLRLVFYGCGPDNPQAARVLWQQLPPGILRDTAAETFVGALAEQDAPAAAACLSDIGSSAIRRNVRADILSAWARKDATAAFAWAQSQPRLHDRDDAIGNVAYTAGQQDPAQAAEMLTTLSSLAVANDSGGVSGVIERWAEEDLTAATTWVKQLPQGPLRDRALESLAASWVEQDPQGAVAFVQTLPEGANRSKLLSQATCAWACQDDKAAFSWLQALPDGSARNSALIGFSDGLAVQKPDQAARFVAALPAGDLQTEAALKVVNRWAEDNPSSAAVWAAALPAGPTREQAVTAAARQWLQGDRVAAEAWLQKTDLPAAAKAKLLHK